MNATQKRTRAEARVIEQLGARAQAAAYASIMAVGGDGAALGGGIPMIDEFSGIGGNTKGGILVPGVYAFKGYNHKALATESWQLNHPGGEGICADVRAYPVEQMPWCAVHAASPICPPFGKANGLPRIFDKQSLNQPTLMDGLAGAEDTRKAARQAEHARGRLLMWEQLVYLRHWVSKGRPVPVGFLENVPEAREWADWDEFIKEHDKIGYDTWLIAYRSDHARPVRGEWAPQARNRLFLAFVHRSVGRTPDWGKWLRPKCWCASCDTWVLGEQTWKEPGVDMGEYGVQYFYRCPNHGGRTVVAEPQSRPALDIIDPSVPGVAVGDPIRFRRSRYQPLADATILRLAAGTVEQWLPLLRQDPAGDGMIPFITAMRGGGDQLRARPASRPLSTISAHGNHHGIAFPPAFDAAEMRSWANQLLVPYYGAASTSRPVSEPIGTLTTKDRYALARLDDWAAWEADVASASVLNSATIKELHRAVRARAKHGTPLTARQQGILDQYRELLAPILYRLLTLDELKLAMGFDLGTLSVATTRDDWVLLLGNAVTPSIPELIVSALVECYTGESLERDVRYV